MTQLINFGYEGKTLHVRVDMSALPAVHNHNEKPIWLFSFAVDKDITAQIIHHALHSYLTDAMAQIRKKAYQQGYKDGRAHRRQLQHFTTTMDPDYTVGY